MRGYWVKIGFGALLIFAVGFGVISAGKKVKASIDSDRDITIPLGSFVPFKLEGAKVGSIRSLTIHRSSPHLLTGFDVHVRLTDTAAFALLQSCHVSVSDAQRLDEQTTFVCLAADSGFQGFGNVTADLRTDTDNRTFVTPLLLSPSAIQSLQRQGNASANVGLADSIAAEVTSRVRVQSRLYRDSIKAAELDRSAARMKERADSIRARTRAPLPAEPAPMQPPRPPPA